MALTGRRCRACGCADLTDTSQEDRSGTWLTVSGVCRACGKRNLFGRKPLYTHKTKVLCPECGMMAKAKSTQGTVRYMKCTDCGHTFKEIGELIREAGQ